MKKNFLFVCAVTLAHVAKSQLVADFENTPLAPESSWYGQDQITDGDTIYTNGPFNFETNYNAGWGSYSGWAVSNVTDNTTPGWSNQYSAITGAGEGGSSQYGVCYVSSWEGNRIFHESIMMHNLEGFYVTNTTYAYYAMLNGDAFTKPFGADTNAQGMIDGTNGEDWFLLTIYGLGLDSLKTGDSVNFYLADYRFPNDLDDYIIDQWTYVDLSSLGDVAGLEFLLTSTDTTGGFGMNNPSYFAMDNLSPLLGVDESEETSPDVYPNPTTGILNVTAEKESVVSIYDMSGKLIFETVSYATSTVIDMSGFENGTYVLRSVSDGIVSIQRVIKQ